MDRARYLGIEIGGTKLQVVVGNAKGGVEDRRRFRVDLAQGGEGIRKQIAGAVDELLTRWNPQGVGVGFGGPVNRLTGRITLSHQVAGWSDFDLSGWLGERSRLNVIVDNDANMAALAEAMVGAGRGADSVFYVTLGSGVGGGWVVGGRIFHGAVPGEAEIGHLRLDRQGTLLESRCSGWAVDSRIRELNRTGASSLLRQLCEGRHGGEACHLAEALRAGDTTARLLVEQVAVDLAFGLSHVTHLMHPDRIVLGGGLSLLGEPLRQAVFESLSGQLMEVFAPGPEVRIAELGEDAVPVGCLLAAERLNRG